jgi:hypothetical protein
MLISSNCLTQINKSILRELVSKESFEELKTGPEHKEKTTTGLNLTDGLGIIEAGINVFEDTH